MDVKVINKHISLLIYNITGHYGADKRHSEAGVHCQDVLH